MKNNSLLTVGLLVGTALSACNQNPYDAFQDKIVTTTKPDAHVVASTNILDVADQTSCLEGKKCIISLNAHVPKPGVASVAFSAPLPVNAVYDSVKSQIVYTPDFDVADANGNKTISVEAMIYDSNQPSTVGYRTFSIVVVNVARPTTVTLVSGDSTVVEGQPFSQVVKVESPDFNGTGDYQLQLTGGPEGIQPTPVTGQPGFFDIQFVPAFNAVTVNDSYVGRSYQKTFKVTYTGFPPQGAKTAITGTWTILDNRLAPQVIAPDAISQGVSANFSISAQDLNGEVAPVIIVDQDHIPTGVIKVTPLVQSTSTGASVANSTQVSVQWDQIDFSKFDFTKPTPIDFQVCVLSAKGYAGNCVNKTTQVTLTPLPSPTPNSSASPSPSPTATPARN